MVAGASILTGVALYARVAVVLLIVSTASAQIANWTGSGQAGNADAEKY
jgi:hypothetical protein